MRNQISGVVGIALGGWIIYNRLMKGGGIADGDGAYATGQYIGFGMGVLMLVAGIYYLLKSDDQPKKKSKKKKKKPANFRPPTPPPPHEL